MEIIKIAMLGITATLLAAELRNHKPVWGIVIGIGAALLIILFSVEKVYLVLEQIKEIYSYLDGGAAYLMILLKVIGVTYLCQFSSGICKDAGFSNLADQIQIFGKLYIMLSGMPILLAFVETIQNL